MNQNWNIDQSVKQGISTITFYHPKSNSLPGPLLRSIADEVANAGTDNNVKVIILKSEGEKAFCAGASFDELASITTFKDAKEFFMGFGRLILAMKGCSKFIITRVQGKAVGGAVGIIAASDYVLATESASIKLSELALGIGPFVIGPAVERKAGFAAFNELAFDAEWHSSKWAKEHGLYNNVLPDIHSLDAAVSGMAEKAAGYSSMAMDELKSVLWNGTENWEELLKKRAETSGRLLLTDHAKNEIARFKSKN